MTNDKRRRNGTSTNTSSGSIDDNPISPPSASLHSSLVAPNNLRNTMPPESSFSLVMDTTGDEPVKIIKTWSPPPGGVQPADSTAHEMQLLLQCLPPQLTEYLQQAYKDRLGDINEVYLQLGLLPKVILGTANDGNIREYLGDEPCTKAHIDLFASFFAQEDSTQAACMTTAKRKGIAQTLHRVSLITNPTREPERVIGVAVRVGRSLQGLLETMAWGSFLKDLADSKHSLLLIGKPGVGKTTVLRQIARTLSEQAHLEVVVVDKTCEIAGDGDMPHAAIGQSRWMPVGVPGRQHEIMREAVENQSPDVIIVDEISTQQEVQAARTIAQRGVMLIATVHGITLPELMHCKERGALTGGVASVTLSGQEAERRFDKRKQVQKRSQEPVFHAALELHSRSKWVYHPSIKEASDSYFEGDPCNAQELQPGRSISIAAIPGEGVFEYCRACGLGRTCSVHIDGHGTAASLPATHEQPRNGYSPSSRGVTTNSHAFTVAGGQNSFANTTFANPNATTGRNTNRNRRRRATRGSGRCRKCGQPGHYARDCPE